jgi:hypothetical protein
MAPRDRAEAERKTTQTIHEMLRTGGPQRKFPDFPVIIRQPVMAWVEPDEISWSDADLALDFARRGRSQAEGDAATLPLIEWWVQVGLRKAFKAFAQAEAAWLRGGPDMPKLRYPDRHDTSDEPRLQMLTAPLVVVKDPGREGSFLLAHPLAVVEAEAC